MKSKNKWWLNLHPSTYFILVFVLVMLLAALSSCVQDFQAQERARVYLQAKAEVFATHVAELKSLPTTSVVIPHGSKGYMFYYYSQSGVDRNKYSIEEYKAAVQAPYGANVELPVEGDHFKFPWAK